MLNRETERDLILRWQRDHDEAARTELYRAFHKLVRKEAHKRKHMDIDDATQIIGIAFTKALDSFDLDDGARFSTHFYWQIRGAFTSNKDRRYVANRVQEVTVLNAPTPWGDQMLDTIPDDAPPFNHDRSRVCAMLARTMQKLKPRQRYVLMGRAMGRTLQDLSDELNVSRERIRQVEEQALDIMRKRVPRELKGYLEDL